MQDPCHPVHFQAAVSVWAMSDLDQEVTFAPFVGRLIPLRELWKFTTTRCTVKRSTISALCASRSSSTKSTSGNTFLWNISKAAPTWSRTTVEGWQVLKYSNFAETSYYEYTSSTGTVQEHLHYTPDEGRVRCVTCNTMFKNATTARQHIKLAHQPQEWYECCFCKAVIRGRLYFSQHIGKKHFKGGTKVVESYGKLVPAPTQAQQHSWIAIFCRRLCCQSYAAVCWSMVSYDSGLQVQVFGVRQRVHSTLERALTLQTIP